MIKSISQTRIDSEEGLIEKESYTIDTALEYIGGYGVF